MKANRFLAILAIVALAIGASVAVGPAFAPRCTRVNGDETVAVSMNDLSRGTARFFCFRDRNGREVRFVLARTSDGTVRAVFDACGQCYRFHKGYTIADGYLVCRLCGNRYRIDQMEQGLASCQPVRLENTQHGTMVEIKVAALEKGQSLF